MSDEFVACHIKELPEDQRIAAAREAIRWNPWNNPLMRDIWTGLGDRLRARLRKRLGLPEPEEEAFGVDPGADGPDAQSLALLTAKYWGVSGVRLTVGWMDNPPADLRARILSHMNVWGQFSNVSFQDVGNPNGAKVRIARNRGQGYYSYLGTDCLMVPPNQCTMNLDSFSMSIPESEFVRVVRHETGHTLGFPHEHMRAEIIAQLDKQKTTAYYGRMYGWTPSQVQQQIFTPLNPSEFTGTSHADELSIMCYQFPGSCTRDGQPIPGGADINAADRAFASSIYPKADAPPDPGNPGPGAGAKQRLVIEYLGDIKEVVGVIYNEEQH